MKRQRVPEPWMFGVEITVNGESVQAPARVGTFTLTGRIRGAYRRLLGRPQFRGTPIGE